MHHINRAAPAWFRTRGASRWRSLTKSGQPILQFTMMKGLHHIVRDDAPLSKAQSSIS
jgi:hypothetical protein